MSERPEILVVCTHNAGRSVAARVLLDHHGAGRVVVQSAGSAPGDTINPAVVQLLTERGLDVSKEFPKKLTDDAARAADIIITMGCGDACPVFPGKRYLDWELTDPERQERRRSPTDRRRDRTTSRRAARRTRGELAAGHLEAGQDHRVAVGHQRRKRLG